MTITAARRRTIYNECELDGCQWVETEGSILVPAERAILITVGLRLASQGKWSHNWRAAYGRSRGQRERVARALSLVSVESVVAHLRGRVRTIKLVRLAPRLIENHDNLPIVFKPLVDQVTCWLAGDNRPNARARDGRKDGYTFSYHQQQQRLYGARVELWP